MAGAVAHADRAHALLSPSGSHRWLHCTPSAQLEATLPDTESEAAKRGTLAHEISEIKLRQLFINPQPKRNYNTALNKKRKHELYEAIMEEHTDAYVDYIQRLVHAFPSPPHVAVEQRVDLTDFVPESFGSSDLIVIGSGRMHVIDYKNGSGVPVEAEDNPQMKLYALGAYKAFAPWFPISEVHLAIVQPKVWDVPSEWSLSVTDLLAWGESIKPIARAAFDGSGEFVPGSHCGFCRAKATCRARVGHLLEAGKHAPMTPPLITWAEAGQALKQAEDIVKWYNALKKLALAEALKGGNIPGWKAVEGRGSRDYVDIDAAFAHLKAQGIDEAVLYERKPLTPPQLEDALTKKTYKELLEDSGLVVKRPGAPALAPDSDKRPAITDRISPEEAFGPSPVQS